MLDGRCRTNLLSLDLNRSQQSLNFNSVYSAPAQRAHSLQDQHHLALFPLLLRTGSARFALERRQDSVVERSKDVVQRRSRVRGGRVEGVGLREAVNESEVGFGVESRTLPQDPQDARSRSERVNTIPGKEEEEKPDGQTHEFLSECLPVTLCLSTGEEDDVLAPTELGCEEVDEQEVGRGGEGVGHEERASSWRHGRPRRGRGRCKVQVGRQRVRHLMLMAGREKERATTGKGEVPDTLACQRRTLDPSIHPPTLASTAPD